MLTYKEDFILKTDQTDTRQNLRYFSFMCLAQEMANVHASILKFGYEELMAQNQVWVLSRAHIKFINPPKWRDKITIETWHKGKVGLFWNRDFALYSQSGELSVAATTAWVIMNTNTRRIERRTIFDTDPSVEEKSFKKDIIETPCDKISLPDNLFFPFGNLFCHLNCLLPYSHEVAAPEHFKFLFCITPLQKLHSKVLHL